MRSDAGSPGEEGRASRRTPDVHGWMRKPLRSPRLRGGVVEVKALPGQLMPSTLRTDTAGENVAGVKGQAAEVQHNGR